MEGKRIPVRSAIAIMAMFGVLVAVGASCNKEKENEAKTTTEEVEVIEPIEGKEYLEEIRTLPAPLKTSKTTVEKALWETEERTLFAEEQPLSLEDFSQLLWSAAGITDEASGRATTPSMHDVRPLELYAYVHGVNTLEAGLYHYIPEGHKIGKLMEGEKREELLKTTYNLSAPGKAPVTLILTGDYEKMREKYPQGETAEKNVHLEAGRTVQNLMLQSATLANVGMVAITEFDPKQLQVLFEIPNREKPLFIIPVGKRDLAGEEAAKQEAEGTDNGTAEEGAEEEETTNE